MPPAPQTTSFHPTNHVGKAAALALRLAEAENALHVLTSGQVDAVINADGKTYLLRPAQESLRRNEKRLQAIIESVVDVITVVDRSGAVIFESPAVRRVLGYQPEELVGSVLFKFIHDTDVSAVYSAFVNVIEGFEENAIVRFRHLTRDGSYCLIEATLGKLHEGFSDSVVFSSRLVTIPHGRATPGSPVDSVRITAPPAVGLPILLGVDGFRANERFGKSLPALEMQPHGMAAQSRMREELDAFAIAGRYAVRLRSASSNAHGDVRLVLDIHQSGGAGPPVELLIDLQAADHTAPADPLRRQQAMWNLVKNTVESFHRDRGSMDAALENAAHELAHPLTDVGEHVEPELLPVVFGSLQQGDEVMSQLYSSLRFGLLVAKGVAEAQRGTLTVTNEAGGPSAPFRLNFKIAPAITA